MTEEIHFEVCYSGNLLPIVAYSSSTGGVAASCSGSRWQMCGSTNVAPHHSADPNWGHSKLGAQLDHKNQPACLFYSSSCTSCDIWLHLYFL